MKNNNGTSREIYIHLRYVQYRKWTSTCDMSKWTGVKMQNHPCGIVACYVKDTSQKRQWTASVTSTDTTHCCSSSLFSSWITPSHLICIKLTFGKLLNTPQMLEWQRRLPECFVGASVTMRRVKKNIAVFFLGRRRVLASRKKTPVDGQHHTASVHDTFSASRGACSCRGRQYANSPHSDMIR